MACHLKNKQCRLLVVIPARGGSKGIPRKALRRVAGRPLIAYTIAQARALRGVCDVLVTTDSPAIARVSKRCGAAVPFLRPAALARDTSPMMPVLRHALCAYEASCGGTIDGIVLFDPTSPLRVKKDMEHMMALFRKGGIDLIVAVRASRRNPFFNMMMRDRRGRGRLVVPGRITRRQDAPRTYDIANNCWIFSRRAVLRGERMPQRTVLYEITGDYLDIDSLDDLTTFARLVKGPQR